LKNNAIIFNGIQRPSYELYNRMSALMMILFPTCAVQAAVLQFFIDRFQNLNLL